MTTTAKTLLLGISIVAVSLISFLLPHEEVSYSSIANNSVQMFLFVCCVVMAFREPTRRNKFIFINFSVLFGFSILFHIYNFLADQGLRLMWFQYVGATAYYFAMSFVIAYVAIDLIFRTKSTLTKYSTTLMIVGTFFVFYYYPLLADSNHIYVTPEAQDFSVIEAVYDQEKNLVGEEPNANVIAQSVVLRNWETGEPLTAQQEEDRILALYPYLLGEQNYVILFIKPLYLNIVYMSVLSLGFILLFFGYQYLKDPPQGAYIEKIMFLFFVFLTIEILHAWSYVKSVEWYSFYEIMNLGQVISIGVLLLIGVFFLLRLRFITSPNGEFYEQEIATSPAGITRWRDMFDELLISHFLTTKHTLGRLFVDRKRVT